MTREEVEQFNREARKGWRFAARTTDERVDSQDRKHRLGGVFVAVGSNLGRERRGQSLIQKKQRHLVQDMKG